MNPWIDTSTAPARTVVLRPLVDWLRRGWVADQPIRVLDLGCGDLLLASLVPAPWRVDGYDLSLEARQAARRRLHAVPGPSGTVHDEPEAIPEGSYDIVVISSVAQYLPDQESLVALLSRARGWLRSDSEAAVVATDLLTARRRRTSDAIDLVRALTPALGLLRTIALIRRSTRHSPATLLRVDEQALRQQVKGAGLDLHRCRDNLSPLRRRASYELRRR